MKLTENRRFRGAGAGLGVLWMAMCLMGMMAAHSIDAQVTTTTVQGTVYLANGQPGSGTMILSWPAFTTAGGQAIAADSTTVTIGSDGFFSVSLAPNQGAQPAGLFYAAVYHMSDGTTSTEYWSVPTAALATLAQVRTQVMPAAQAVQAVSKSYVDQAIAEATGSLLTASGGNLTGPLYLNEDPTQPLQAATKHYVDTQAATALPLTGGTLTGPFTATKIGGLYQVDQIAGADFGARLQACVNALNASYGGTCDARNFTGSLTMSSNLTIATPNTTVLLPCATITTAYQVIVSAGVRNTKMTGCAYQGGSAASGTSGGTVWVYTGSSKAFQVGDSTYSTDTVGFNMQDVQINTASAGSSAAAMNFYRTQEIKLEDLYAIGNGTTGQFGITLDGTGNYTGGAFDNLHILGFGEAIYGTGHLSGTVSDDYANASTFSKLHIDCPTSSGSPISGTFGIDIAGGDGNTFDGGDVEGCATALHLGANAQNNTIVGLRNENSTSQVVADAGSAYNNWMTGGTMFTGKLTDNGTRNSFLDTFHRSFNGLNGDWYGSQQDATLTNHWRLGTGAGNERGLLNEIQTDYGYRWLEGYSDATAGEQFYQIEDLLNSVNRISIGQYNNGSSNTNNQTVINAAGTGAVVLNGSNNSGTGGVVIGSGGPSGTTVATISNSGNAQFNGTLQVGGTAQSAGTMTVRNNADAEVDYYLWPGLTASQKGSFTYKDWNGNSQWYMVKDASNNWALNSAVGGLDIFKAYQSTNSGDTYINASNSTGHIRLNYESGSGAETDIYSGSSANLDAAFLSPTSIKFPGLAAASGTNCLQIDNSGYITKTGSACGSGSGSSSFSSLTGGTNTTAALVVGTGATLSITGTATLTAPDATSSSSPSEVATIDNLHNAASRSIKEFGAVGDNTTDDTAAINAGLTWEQTASNGCLYFPPGVYKTTAQLSWTYSNNLCILGDDAIRSAIYYRGTSAVDSALLIHSSSSTNGGYTSVRMENITIAANTNASYAFHGVQIAGSPLRNVHFSGGSQSAFEGDFWNGMGNLDNLEVAPNTVPSGVTWSCVNGLTFNAGLYQGTSNYFPSTQFTLNSPMVMNCSGTGLNFQSSYNITVNNGQISNNHQNLYDGCNGNPLGGCGRSGNTFTGTLFEADTNTTADSQEYENSHFINAEWAPVAGDGNIDTYAAVTFEGGEVADLVTESGNPGPILKNLWWGNITDNSEDGIQWESKNHNMSNPVPDSTHCQSIYYPGQNVLRIDYSFVNTPAGTYALCTTPTATNGGQWYADAFMNIKSDNISNAPATAFHQELSYVAGHNVITFPNSGANITINPTSTGINAVVANGTDGAAVYGVLTLYYYASANSGYETPAYAAMWSDPVLFGSITASSINSTASGCTSSNPYLEYNGSCGAGGSATNLTVGSTSVASGTNAYLLYNNNGVLGNEAASSLTVGTAATANGLSGSPTSGQYWGYNGTAQGWYSPSGSGTVTSVGLSVPSDETVTGSPITSSGTLAVTRNSQSANLFLASPNGASGAPSYRAIVAADVPTLNQSTTGTAANVTGTVAIANGGTGTATAPSSAQIPVAQSATAYAPKTLSGDCTLSSAGAITCTKTNGTVFGSLATLSTATIATGGTGATTATAALSNLLGNPTAGTYAATCSSTSSCTYSSYTGTQTITSGSLALATSSIASGACQAVTAGSVNSATATGVATTDVILWTPNAALSSVTGYAPSTSGGLSIQEYPTSGYVNFNVCNWSAAAITPGAVTLNWRVVR